MYLHMRLNMKVMLDPECFLRTFRIDKLEGKERRGTDKLRLQLQKQQKFQNART